MKGADFFHPKIDWNRGRTKWNHRDGNSALLPTWLLSPCMSLESPFAGRFLNWLLFWNSTPVVGWKFRSPQEPLSTPALILAPPPQLFSLMGRHIRWLPAFLRGFGRSLPLALWYRWGKWSHHLTIAYNRGENYFAKDFPWQAYWDNLHNPYFLKRFFWFVLPMYMSTGLLSQRPSAESGSVASQTITT
ncbi:hypothetical protein [Pajaroellobacter abortibovis]|uniref:Uncharacterized protein n=1 Tax=Pajaroellobacter abortibovis TaxID=1882918 RepID=A0A1L6MYP3_9BACT|nr:hypothetical protein [Pajaroellobacter abortibovis]APS00701.1 hypothetical protein BCY86_08435 [Pajaroellobacter abortibovis]